LNWLGTLWSGCLFLTTQIFFIIGFLFSFCFGGFSGIILSNCIIDTLLHDTYFVVGHFHFVLSLGAVYTIFSSFYHYYSLFFNDWYINELLGRMFFVLFFCSNNLLFFSLHVLGSLGFPRRVFDYSLYYFRFHWLNSLGSIILVLSLFLFLLSLL
jgi:cytochrome c oxidase subunit 1